MIQSLATFDLQAFQSIMASRRHARLLPWARLVSASADGWLYALLLPFALLLHEPANFQPQMTLLVRGFLLERALYFVLKNLIQRARPAQRIVGYRSAIVAADKYSLPSGHSSAAFFSCGFLCLALSSGFLPLYLWALAVGASRVILGVHFPLDIVCGALLGSGVALIMVGTL